MTEKKKRKYKSGEPRTRTIVLAVSESELQLIDTLRDKRVERNGKSRSRTDTIVDCIKHALMCNAHYIGKTTQLNLINNEQN